MSVGGVVAVTASFSSSLLSSLAMEVPFMSWLQRRVKCGTEVIAPPGAHTVTPRSPSIVGPRDVHVYGAPGT